MPHPVLVGLSGAVFTAAFVTVALQSSSEPATSPYVVPSSATAPTVADTTGLAVQSRQAKVFILTGASDLTPSSLAALDAPDTVVSQMLAQIDPDQPAAAQVLAAMQSWSDAHKQAAAAMEAARKEPSAKRVAEYRALQQTSDAAKAVLASTKQNLAAACRQGLSSEQQAQLKRLREAEKAGLPVEFGLALNTAKQRQQALSDLSAEKEALSTGEASPAEVQSRLSTLRTSLPVIQAKQRLDGRREAVMAMIRPTSTSGTTDGSAGAGQ
jgi:hypothetical protein